MNFERIAPFYQLIESLTAGSSAQQCRTALLHHLAFAKSVLLLGEGNGRYLCVLRERFPEMEITVVDSSAKMLQLLRERLATKSFTEDKITLIEQDILHWEVPVDRYDAVVANFFFNCFGPTELKTLIHKIAPAIKLKGICLLADFREPRQWFRRLRAKIILKLMYGFFRYSTQLDARRLSSPDEPLEDAGFHLRERELHEWGLLHADLWVRRGEGRGAQGEGKT